MTRAILGTVVAVAFAYGGPARADLASGSGLPTARPSSGSDIRLTRLMPSYTTSYLASLGTPESTRAIAEQSVGAVHLAGNEVFYARCEAVNGTPNAGVGPGGDGSADTTVLPPPPTATVPAPGALGLGIVGMALISSRRRRR